MPVQAVKNLFWIVNGEAGLEKMSLLNKCKLIFCFPGSYLIKSTFKLRINRRNEYSFLRLILESFLF